MLSSNSSPVRKLFLRSFLVLIHGAVRTNSNTYPAGPGRTAQPPSCIKQLTDNCGVRSGSFPYSRHTRAILRFPSIQWGIRLLRGILAVQSVGSSCTRLRTASEERPQGCCGRCHQGFCSSHTKPPSFGAATVNSELVLAAPTVALHPDSDLHLGHLCVLGI